MIPLAVKNISTLCRRQQTSVLMCLIWCLHLFMQGLSIPVQNPAPMTRSYQSCLKSMVFLWTSYMTALNISAQSMKKWLKSLTIRFPRNILSIFPILILTARISTLKLTGKMTSGWKALQKKTGKNLSLVWGCSLTQNRSRSAWKCIRETKVKNLSSEISSMN